MQEVKTTARGRWLQHFLLVRPLKLTAHLCNEERFPREETPPYVPKSVQELLRNVFMDHRTECRVLTGKDGETHLGLNDGKISRPVQFMILLKSLVKIDGQESS